jgi:Domain of unknown function (DUF4192)
MTANDSPTAATPRLSLRAPDAILAAVPHMLGFYPSHSLVVLGLGGKRNKVHVTFRYDLPEPPDAALAADIADHATSVLRKQRLRLAVLVGYGPPALVMPVLAPTLDWMRANGIQLHEVLRAEGGRYWSVLCSDPRCCPPEGRPFDPCSHPAAAAMAEAGLHALPDRAALTRTLQPPAGSAQSIRDSTRRAEQRLYDLGAERWAALAGDRQPGSDGLRDSDGEPGSHGEPESEDQRGSQSRLGSAGQRGSGGQRRSDPEPDSDPQQLTAEIGRAELQRAIRCYREGGSVTSGDELAWFAVLLADLRVRDDAWARMDPAYVNDHIRLWTDVVRGAAVEYVPAPASLLAFVAWQAGSGALGSVAVDRALAARPGYSMGLLIESALQAGLPPSAAKLPMTPEQVARSYAAQYAKARKRRRRQPDSARSSPAGSRSGATTRGASKRPSG